ncbi:MAG: bifunctional nuclease family protein [Bacteroidaceae bacterium]|nr:bifunctional nuclease family protein [Bacteroidales bacterium]MEA4966751.1 bifunctional nuclease family protein [Bacteroidaceae bacterium]MEA5100088.1 bifunctional nuclease family protein [Bacteroidales bacterium]
MDKKRVKIVKIEKSVNDGLYNVFLQEEEGQRMLNIMIGDFEAKKMSMIIDKIEPPRPLTYDLFYNVLFGYDISIDEVIITKFFEGVYFANIVCSNNGQKKVFDARTSDAINMALKYNSPIFASEEILQDVGFLYQEEKKDSFLVKEFTIIIEPSKQVQIKELEKLLEIAVEDEDYDSAADLRDRIDKIKQELDNKD